MNDKKRLNAEGAHQITQGEKDAWHRGKGDALKNLKLSGVDGVDFDKAIKIVRLFADGGNEQFIRQKVGLSVSDIRKVLAKFNIQSIEDARSVVNKGLVAELDAARSQERQVTDATQKTDEAQKAEKLREHEKEFGQKPKASNEEVDAKLRTARDEAFRKNKAEKIKSLIAQGISKEKTSGFVIQLADIPSFKSMIPYGVGQLQRRFGGSKKDILAEIRRLSPETDVDMLRP